MTKTISLTDLSHVISKIGGLNRMHDVSKNIASNLPKPGEHVAVYWVQDSNEVVWYQRLMSYTLREAWLPKPVSVVSGANGRIGLNLVFTGRINHRIYALFDANSHNLRSFEQ